MNNKTLTTLTLALAFLGGFLFFYNLKSTSPPTQENSSASDTQQKLESKIDDQANVTITVTPSDFLPESKEWKFNIIMSTHSVELDQDITKIALLADGRGKEYKPIRWKGAEAGGHHREGVLIFNQIIPTPKSLELKISNIGDVVRSFTWQL